MYCRICGDEPADYRPVSRMTLCESCAKDTPAKVGFGEFLDATFRTDPGWSGKGADLRIAREFFDDYKHSKHGCPDEYWAACSS